MDFSLGFRVYGSGLRVKGFRAWGSGLEGWEFGFNLEFRVPGLAYRGLRFRASDLECRGVRMW